MKAIQKLELSSIRSLNSLRRLPFLKCMTALYTNLACTLSSVVGLIMVKVILGQMQQISPKLKEDLSSA